MERRADERAQVLKSLLREYRETARRAESSRRARSLKRDLERAHADYVRVLKELDLLRGNL